MGRIATGFRHVFTSEPRLGTRWVEVAAIHGTAKRTLGPAYEDVRRRLLARR